MPEATITRSVIIIVEDVGDNSYGDLTFTDKADGQPNQYKISAKRKQYFEKVIVPEMAVQLNYAMSSFGKEYIYSAVQVKDNLPPPVKPSIVTIKKLPSDAPPAEKVKDTSFKERQDSIQQQTAIKEVGEDWRAGKLPDDHIFVLARKIWLQTQLHVEIGEALGEKVKPTTEPKLSPDAVESKSRGIETPISSPVSNIPEFVNAGEFFKWCKEIYPSKMPSWIKTTVGLPEKPTSEQLRQAAITLINMEINN